MLEVKAPNKYSEEIHYMKSVFLAGSIEMGAAENWQAEVVEKLKDVEDLLLLNPRRDDWDASWEQSIENEEFRKQVEWELDGLKKADYIMIYYCPETKAPITMMEFGLYAKNNPEKLIICCPEGFERKGNVDIVCKRYGIRQVESIDEMVEVIKRRVA